MMRLSIVKHVDEVYCRNVILLNKMRCNIDKKYSETEDDVQTHIQIVFTGGISL